MSSLRESLKNNKIVVAPGCHDPLSARIIETLGFEAIYLGGWATGNQMMISEPLITLAASPEGKESLVVKFVVTV